MSPHDPILPHHLPDFDHELENDALWSVLNEATKPEIPSRFTADTLRRCRLEVAAPKTVWWQKLLCRKLIAGTAATALAILAIIISLPADPPPAPAQTQTTPITPLPNRDWGNLEDTLAEELLTAAAEDPTLLSDEEIVSLLF